MSVSSLTRQLHRAAREAIDYFGMKWGEGRGVIFFCTFQLKEIGEKSWKNKYLYVHVRRGRE